MLADAASSITDWVQTAGLIFTIVWGIWQGRRQAQDRRKELADATEDRKKERESAEERHQELLAARDSQLRTEIADRRRERLVATYPEWLAALVDYCVAVGRQRVGTPSPEKDNHVYEARLRLQTATLAIRLDENSETAQNVLSIQDRSVRWKGVDVQEGQQIVQEGLNLIDARIQAWRGAK